jgi:hypothetical protein
MLGATIRICTPTRNLIFSSWSNLRLRKCMNYVQQRVMEMRQHGLIMQQQMQTQVNGIPQLQGNGNGGGYQLGRNGAQQNAQNGGNSNYIPINPYTKSPILMRRRRFPSFY